MLSDESKVKGGIFSKAMSIYIPSTIYKDSKYPFKIDGIIDVYFTTVGKKPEVYVHEINDDIEKPNILLLGRILPSNLKF